MIKLSIIIPAYNAEPYIHELINVLEPQVNKEIQVILIDDGSYKPLEIDKNWIEFYSNVGNKGTAYTRNRGMELAKGKYIHFIDADDLVAENYIKYVIDKIDSEDFDYMDLSWKSIKGGGAQFDYMLKSDDDSLPVPSASLRVFNKKFIGNHIFNIKKDAAEDADFTRHLDLKRGKRICATEYMYFYRTYTPNSNCKLFLAGETNTHRIAYYYNHFTPNMKTEIEQIKKDDEQHEVILITNKCDVPGIEQYCDLVCPPGRVRAMEVKGESNSFVELIPMPLKTDLVIWIHQTFPIGGIETFIYSFCENMHEKYDIVVLYDIMDQIQIDRVSKYAKCVKNSSQKIVCDTVIVVRIFDSIPSNIRYKKSVQMAHCLKQRSWSIPQTRDAIVCVSNASKESFGEEGKDAKVINNMSYKFSDKEVLFLISATRVGAVDKGKNDERMVKLAKLMNTKGIKYIWAYFGNRPLHSAPQEMVYMGQSLDVTPYIKKADYLVQLSDTEAFSYALLESLCLQTPLIVTPLEQNEDMKIKDGVNAYIVPFDFDDSYDVEKFLKIPKFTYKYDNKKIIEQWVDLIENTKPMGVNPNDLVFAKAKMTYNDMQLNKIVSFGEIIRITKERADELIRKGLVEIEG